MDQLRSLFEGLGLSNVETFIASGNVIFDSKSKNPAALERSIEKHLEQNLGYEVKTFLRAIPELATIANYKPFPDSELNSHALYIGFAADSLTAEAGKKLLSFISEVDDLHIHNREIYWLCRADRMSDSRFSGALTEKNLGQKVTFRNATTIRKLAAKYDK
jgi:uncharacterized protein (DUF1697 family)